MKPSLYKSNLFFAMLLMAALFFIGPTVFAQEADTAPTKINASRPKRVLYGMASFYANKFNGRRTALGEIFNQKKFTCACNVLPLGTWIRVTNLRNGRTVIVKTNDRLHPKMKRIIDLTRAAATQLGYVGNGLTRVKVEVIGKKPPKND